MENKKVFDDKKLIEDMLAITGFTEELAKIVKRSEDFEKIMEAFNKVVKILMDN